VQTGSRRRASLLNPGFIAKRLLGALHKNDEAKHVAFIRPCRQDPCFQGENSMTPTLGKFPAQIVPLGNPVSTGIKPSTCFLKWRMPFLFAQKGRPAA
jgi:hypothetical protein